LRDPDERFWHRKHAVTTTWSLLAAAVTFVATTLYQRRDSAQQVFVTNQDTTVRIVTVRDSLATDYLRQLVDEMHQLRLSSRQRPSPSPRTEAPPASPTTPPVQTPEAKPSADADTKHDAGLPRTVQDGEAQPEPTRLADPPYRFPKRPDAIAVGDLQTLAKASCPDRSVAPGQEVAFSVALRSHDLVAKVTPLFVEILKRESPTRAVGLLGQQYEPRRNATFTLPAPRTPGSYEVGLGYYLLADTLAQFPTFYELRCTLTVE